MGDDDNAVIGLIRPKVHGNEGVMLNNETRQDAQSHAAATTTANVSSEYAAADHPSNSTAMATDAGNSRGGHASMMGSAIVEGAHAVNNSHATGDSVAVAAVQSEVVGRQGEYQNTDATSVTEAAPPAASTPGFAPRSGKVRRQVVPTARSSTRVTKRRRFDDDGVEGTTPKRPDIKAGSTRGDGTKRLQRPVHLEKIRDWRAIDDAILISGLQQVPDLAALHKTTRFSQKYTLQEVSERWTALLYDQNVSNNARKDLIERHAKGDLFAINRVPWSEREEMLIISNVPRSGAPSLSTFEDLWQRHRHAFHPTRRPKDLMRHLNLMNYFSYTPRSAKSKAVGRGAQSNPAPSGATHASEVVADVKLDALRDLAMSEIDRVDRKLKKRIREVESTVTEWDEISNEKADSRRAVIAAKDSKRGAKVLGPKSRDGQGGAESEKGRSESKGRKRSVVDANSVTFHSHFADTGAGAPLAVVEVDKGSTYSMVKNEMLIGRQTKELLVDIDLQNSKVSRRQAVIIYRDREFVLRNEGKRSMFVNSTTVATGHTCILSDQSLLTISGSSLMFSINPKLRKPGYRDQQK